MNLRKSLIVLLSLLVWTLPETHATGKKILYIGDSVTDGNWGKVSGGPNRSLTDMNHIFGHGYMFICAARYMADYPEEDYRFYNRGISGNRVADLKARWQQDALEIDPGILSVLVGVNDLLDVYNKTDGPQEVDTARFEADYRDILDRSRAQNPEVRIVLAEPFILPVGMWQEHYTHWRAQCDRLGAVVKKLAKEYDAVFLPYQGLFDKLAHDGRTPKLSYWMWDGTHPTAAGHEKMAELWMQRVGSKL